MTRAARSRASMAILIAWLAPVLASCRQPPMPATEDTGSPPADGAGSQAASAPVDPAEALWKRTYAIALAKDTALAGTEGGLVAWDVEDRSAPRHVAHLVLPGSVSSVTLLDVEGGPTAGIGAALGPMHGGGGGPPSPGTRLVAASTGPSGVVIADVPLTGEGGFTLISDGKWSSAGGCNAAWALREASAGRAYVACGSSGVAEADLADPAHPRVVRAMPIDGYVRDLAVIAGGAGKQGSVLVAAAAGLAGLVVVEFPARGEPRILAALDSGGEARAIAMAGSIAWIADGPMDLLGVDLAVPSAPREIGRLDLDASDMSRGIAVDGGRAYLCMGDSGLAVVDIADPASPRLLGKFDPERALNRVAVAGTVAFLGNDDGGILILDLADPASPVKVFPR